MPYFKDVERALHELLEWADVRHEQGVKPRAALTALKRRITALKRQLEHTPPGRKLAEAEPNTLSAIRALRDNGPRRMAAQAPADYADRLKGAFLGRAAGCTLGAPVENWRPERMRLCAEYHGDKFPPRDYFSDVDEHYHTRYSRDLRTAYTRRGIRYVPVDDDLVYTLLGLLILEDHGPDFGTAEVAQSWLKYLDYACTAEAVALANLKAGVSWKHAGARNNPYMEWIGADIRSDPWGYACPGWPEKAAEMAYHDAFLSHRYNGIYGEMYFSAVIAAAFVCADPVEALHIGLTEIPRTCRLYKDLTWALAVAPKVKDHAAACALVQKRFGKLGEGMHHVHTNNNACLTVWGITIGRGDFTRTIGQTVAMGFDCDCTAATAGSILGAVLGARHIPPHWTKPFRDRCRSYLVGREWFRISDVCRRFAVIARRVTAKTPAKKD